MSNPEKFLKAVKKLRETKTERKFDQTVDLVINLQNFDVRREAFNMFIQVPNKIKDKKIGAFFEKKSSLVDTITKDDFGKYKEKKDIKKLIKTYDFFIANAKLMPAIATNFGRILGPFGKMPNPQLGILPKEDDAMIKAVLIKINSTIRLRVKEPSIKIGVAKESLTDEQIVQNLMAAYKKILEQLPKNTENIKDILIKFSMDKPVKIE